jgi:hypothetical protein
MAAGLRSAQTRPRPGFYTTATDLTAIDTGRRAAPSGERSTRGLVAAATHGQRIGRTPEGAARGLVLAPRLVLESPAKTKRSRKV